MGAKLFQQMIEMRQAIGLVAVNDEIFFPIGRSMDHLVRHHHPAKTHAGELINELIMVAGDVNHLGVLAAFAEQFLDEHIIVITPEPAEPQFPAVNQVADDIKIFAVHHAEKFQQFRDASVPRAEVDVRNPDRPANDRLTRNRIQVWLIHSLIPTALCNITNNFGNRLLPS
jgi:hypothetical protein